MPIAKDFKSIHCKEWEVYFSQCYPNGSLKLPELANLLQLVAAEHADLGGVGFADFNAYDQSWVMNRMRIEIGEMPSSSDKIDIKTWVEELKGVKSLRDFEINCQGKKYIGVSTLWAIFNMKTRRPEAIKINTDHVERFPEVHSTAIAAGKIDNSFVVTEKHKYKVQFSDLDIVNHANNTKYLEWCLNVIDPQIILQKKINTIDMNFMKEVSLNDEISIGVAYSDNTISFRIEHEGAVNFLCVLGLG